MVPGFELGPHAPGIREGIVLSQQGRGGSIPVSFALAGSQAESDGTGAAVEGYGERVSLSSRTSRLSDRAQKIVLRVEKKGAFHPFSCGPPCIFR